MTYKGWQGADRPVHNGAKVVRRAFESDDDAPGQARAALTRAHGKTDEDVLERGLLLVSELVANAVKHAGGDEVRIEIAPGPGSFVVLVADDGPGFTPVPQPTTVLENDGGFGLPLLDTLSDRWGSGHDSETWVWFEVRPRPQPAPPAQELDRLRASRPPTARRRRTPSSRAPTLRFTTRSDAASQWP